MMDWELEISFHWPHDRMALGWEIIRPDEIYEYTTVTLYLVFLTIKLDIE
jgi:hypothetical protein